MRVRDPGKFAERTAFLDDAGGSLTYGELADEGESLAGAAGERCLVFQLCRNSLGSVLGYVSFLRHGIVPVMLSARMERGLMDGLLDAYRPRYLWLPDDLAGDFAEMGGVYSSRGYSLLETRYRDDTPLYPELALLLTTSGSTGSPKFVRQSYRNISSNAEAIARYLELDRDERPITSLPMNYTYGLSVINSHLLVGAEVLLTEKGVAQREFWRFFRESGATSLAGVPYTYEMLDRMRFYGMSLPSLCTLTQAGGRLPVPLQEKFARYAADTGRRFVVMYGACEATARMSYLPAELAASKPGSVGVAIPGGKFHLRGEDGEELTGPGAVGELIYEGENVTLGYAESRDDLAKGDERHGVLPTGDLARFDGDGCCYIVGRKKRFLKIYGNRVSLDDAERLLREKFSSDAACVGTDDRMKIFVTGEVPPGDAKEYLSRELGLNPAAFTAYHIDEIPKNDAGKTLYGELEGYRGV